MVEPFIRFGYQRKRSGGDGETDTMVTSPPGIPLIPCKLLLFTFWPVVCKWAWDPILTSESRMEAMTTLETRLLYCSKEKVMPEKGLPSRLHFLPWAQVVTWSCGQPSCEHELRSMKKSQYVEPSRLAGWAELALTRG